MARPDEIQTTIDDRELEEVVISPVCVHCDHLDPDGERSCTAFDVIPDSIWSGKNSHKRPYPGDRGIQFTPYKRGR